MLIDVALLAEISSFGIRGIFADLSFIKLALCLPRFNR